MANKGSKEKLEELVRAVGGLQKLLEARDQLAKANRNNYVRVALCISFVLFFGFQQEPLVGLVNFLVGTAFVLAFMFMLFIPINLVMLHLINKNLKNLNVAELKDLGGE